MGRLVVDEPSGPVTVSAEVLGVTVAGCELRVFTPIGTDRAALLGVEVRQTTLWVPVRTRNVRRTSRGWTISSAFDRPTAQEQRSIYMLMADHNGR